MFVLPPQVRVVLGIDPGASGWVVGLSLVSDSAISMKLPFDEKGDLRWVDLFRHFKSPPLVAIEDVRGRGGWSATANFSFGLNLGLIRQAVSTSGWDYLLVKPQAWQKAICSSIPNFPKLKDSKTRTLVAYEILFPHDPLPRSAKGKLNDNAVDAWMIATFLATEGMTKPVRKWSITK